MSNAVGYTRLSQESDTSIDRQKRHIREYCRENGFTLVKMYDDGERSSGFDTESREDYQRLRKRIVDDENLDAVIVNDKRRLARDVDEVMRLIPDLRTEDVELHTHQDGPLDLSDPMKAAIEILQAAAAHEEKLKEIRKAIEAVEERLEAGHDHGRPRYGMKYNDEGTRQVPGDDFDQVMEVLQLDRAGFSVRQIAEKVDPAKSTVQNILDRREWYVERTKDSETA